MIDSTKSAITCSKLTIEALKQDVKYAPMAYFTHISHLVPMFLLLTLSREMSTG